MQKQHLRLSETDRQELEGLFSKSSLTVKIHKRIAVLLLLNKGESYKEVGQELGITYPAMKEICNKYLYRNELSSAIEYLADKQRIGRPIVISGTERAKITALACSDAPEGHSTWTLRLLADKVVELVICERIAHTQVGVILKKTICNHILNAHGA